MQQESICIIQENNILQSNADSVFPIYSIAKPIIAYLIMQTGVKHNVKLADLLTKELVPSSDLTIGHLLNHSSGIEDYGHQSSYSQAIAEQDFWQDADFIKHTINKPLLYDPGTGFNYSNPNYWLLVQILEVESGRSFQQLVHEEVCQTLNLPSVQVKTGIFADDLNWYPASWVWHGLIVANALDTAQFIRTYGRLIYQHSYQEGNWQPVGAASKPWVSPHYGWGLMMEPNVMYGHNGEGPNYSASCFHFESRDTTVCVLCGDAGLAPDTAFSRLIEIKDNNFAI